MSNIRKNLLKTGLLMLCILFGSLILKTEAVQATTNAKAAAKRGWVDEGGNRYYYTKKGEKALGFKSIGKHRYYFDLKTGAMFRNRWRQISGKHYFFQRNGRMARSTWIKSTYYVNKNGVRQRNKWIGRRFVGEDGKQIRNFKGGFHRIGNEWYFYTARGRKQTGWITHNGKRYFLDGNGVRVTKRQVINKKTYFFTKNGVLRTGGWIKRGKWYYKANRSGVINTRDRMNAKTRAAATIIEYNSAKMKIRLEKKREFNTNYWVARVRVNNPKQLVHALAHGTYGGTLQTTSSAVRANNAILGINGSAFNGRGVPSPMGMCIVDGKIYGNFATSFTVMSIMNDGTLRTAPQGLYGRALLNMGVRSTLNFGPIILENGKTVPFSRQGNSFSLVNHQDPRTAIGMVSAKEYIVLVADGRSSVSAGLNYTQMLQIFRRYGAQYAYNLDGGGSATIAYKGQVLNKPSDGRERPCGDFILFKN